MRGGMVGASGVVEGIRLRGDGGGRHCAERMKRNNVREQCLGDAEDNRDNKQVPAWPGFYLYQGSLWRHLPDERPFASVHMGTRNTSQGFIMGFLLAEWSLTI
jgi:hypothetical protein